MGFCVVQTYFPRYWCSSACYQILILFGFVPCAQDAVEELATNPPPVIERLRPTLRDLKDLDPAIASLHHRRIQPSRLLSLLSTMRKVPFGKGRLVYTLTYRGAQLCDAECIIGTRV